ncbi:hypothetical protein FNF29_02031 [Cafeteria roenbergensis]|uniref:Polymerase nucleotidyl transferase domain-containing protein n=1 Tax=Cafeteria roenbergensis TaxID=33653 RepID=A0A5A8CRW3_CAFRO|nr:hypothetical protein FNF29_02031 [Cafeteria roenbergensis]|eukprot:KAA0154890.1 hypothetical protein FNF29_02031 [Cafeteria roenbergensis]
MASSHRMVEAVHVPAPASSGLASLQPPAAADPFRRSGKPVTAFSGTAPGSGGADPASKNTSPSSWGPGGRSPVAIRRPRPPSCEAGTSASSLDFLSPSAHRSGRRVNPSPSPKSTGAPGPAEGGSQVEAMLLEPFSGDATSSTARSLFGAAAAAKSSSASAPDAASFAPPQLEVELDCPPDHGWLQAWLGDEILAHKQWALEHAQWRRGAELAAVWRVLVLSQQHCAGEARRSRSARSRRTRRVRPSGVTVRIFGSMISGLALPLSDVDVVLEGASERDFHATAQALRQQAWVRSSKEIMYTSVPIIKVVTTQPAYQATSLASRSPLADLPSSVASLSRSALDSPAVPGAAAASAASASAIVSAAAVASAGLQDRIDAGIETSGGFTSDGEWAVQLDLTMHTPMHRGLLTTEFAMNSVAAVPALAPLVLFFKHVLRAADLHDSATGGLPSYAVLVIARRGLGVAMDDSMTASHIVHRATDTPSVAASEAGSAAREGKHGSRRTRRRGRRSGGDAGVSAPGRVGAATGDGVGLRLQADGSQAGVAATSQLMHVHMPPLHMSADSLDAGGVVSWRGHGGSFGPADGIGGRASDDDDDEDDEDDEDDDDGGGGGEGNDDEDDGGDETCSGSGSSALHSSEGGLDGRGDGADVAGVTGPVAEAPAPAAQPTSAPAGASAAWPVGMVASSRDVDAEAADAPPESHEADADPAAAGGTASWRGKNTRRVRTSQRRVRAVESEAAHLRPTASVAADPAAPAAAHEPAAAPEHTRTIGAQTSLPAQTVGALALGLLRFVAEDIDQREVAVALPQSLEVHARLKPEARAYIGIGTAGGVGPLVPKNCGLLAQPTSEDPVVVLDPLDPSLTSNVARSLPVLCEALGIRPHTTSGRPSGPVAATAGTPRA